MNPAEIFTIGNNAIDIIEKLPRAKKAVEELFGKKGWAYRSAEAFVNGIETRFKAFLNTGEKGYFIVCFHWSYSRATHDNSKTTWFYIWEHNVEGGFSMKWNNVPSMKNQAQQLEAIHAFFNALIENGTAMKTIRSQDDLPNDTWNGVVIEFLLHLS